jgi:hypothetical protein
MSRCILCIFFSHRSLAVPTDAKHHILTGYYQNPKTFFLYALLVTANLNTHRLA